MFVKDIRCVIFDRDIQYCKLIELITTDQVIVGSKATLEGFAVWEAFDDALDTYCFLPQEEEKDAEYVDLLLNPERYTGYKGKSAQRIWHTIYMENCFR